MVQRGGFSFVAMLVINPIVILFYQNCSMTPISHAKNNLPPVASRQIASENNAVAVQYIPGCQDQKRSCLKAE